LRRRVRPRTIMGMKSISEPALPTFEMAIAVEPGDIDELGHVNNVVYLRWVQDIAVAHWRAAASRDDQEKLLWIVVRHEIDYRQAARLGDRILARTWVGAATRIKFERHTELLRASDGGLLAKARTVWCPIDSVTGKPTGVSAAVRAVFSAGQESQPDQPQINTEERR
jgi:acyl-CoA thioester hydrolase